MIRWNGQTVATNVVAKNFVIVDSLVNQAVFRIFRASRIQADTDTAFISENYSSNYFPNISLFEAS